MPKRFYCSSGNRKRKLYEPYYTESGSRQLRCIGEDDIFDYIQSFKASCDIKTLLKRFELGDTSALLARPGVYADFINAPSTLAEYLNVQIKAKQLFDSLPADVRSSFNNDPNQFFVKIGTPEFEDIARNYIKPTEVTTDES